MKIRMFELGSVGTNCYLVWEEESREAMLIDPGAYEKEIDRMIAENELVLKYIALTHGHGDHICGVDEFQSRYPDAMLVAGAKEIALLKDPEQNLSEIIGGKRIILTPELTLMEGDELNLGYLSFRVIDTPGHTLGGICFYVREWDEGLLGQLYSGTVFSGDTLFNTSIGRTDLPGGDYDVLKASIKEKLYTLPDDTMVLPGHMDATTIGYEKRNNMFVK